MRAVSYRKYHWRQRWPRQHFNPHNNLVFKRVSPRPGMKPREIELELGAGRDDRTVVYRQGPFVYVVSINRSLGYAGVEEFRLTDEPKSIEQGGGAPAYLALRPSSDLFLQNDWDVEYVLGPRGVDYEDATIARRLIARLADMS